MEAARRTLIRLAYLYDFHAHARISVTLLPRTVDNKSWDGAGGRTTTMCIGHVEHCSASPLRDRMESHMPAIGQPAPLLLLLLADRPVLGPLGPWLLPPRRPLLPLLLLLAAVLWTHDAVRKAAVRYSAAVAGNSAPKERKGEGGERG